MEKNKQKTNEEWADFDRRYKESGMKVADFCDRAGLNQGAFQSARQRLGLMNGSYNRGARAKTAKKASFVSFVPETGSLPIRVERNGSIISISTPAMLREVLDVLEGRGN